MTMPIETAKIMLQEQFPGMIVDWDNQEHYFNLKKGSVYLLMDTFEKTLSPVTFLCRKSPIQNRICPEYYDIEYQFQRIDNNIEKSVYKDEFGCEVIIFNFIETFCCK